MATPTLSERFATALRARGWAELAPLSGCRVFRHPTTPEIHAYVGKAGSLRFGRTRTYSLAAHPAAKAKLLEEAGHKFPAPKVHIDLEGL